MLGKGGCFQISSRGFGGFHGSRGLTATMAILSLIRLQWHSENSVPKYFLTVFILSLVARQNNLVCQ